MVVLAAVVAALILACPGKLVLKLTSHGDVQLGNENQSDIQVGILDSNAIRTANVNASAHELSEVHSRPLPSPPQPPPSTSPPSIGVAERVGVSKARGVSFLAGPKERREQQAKMAMARIFGKDSGHSKDSEDGASSSRRHQLI